MTWQEPGALRPRLADGVQRRRTVDERLVLVGAGRDAYLDVHPHEEALLDLIDGAHSLDQLIEEALCLTVPIRPMDVLAFFRRLTRADLVVGMERAEQSLFGGAHTGPLRMLDRLMDVSLHTPWLGGLSAPGAWTPRGFWRPLHILSALALLSGLVVTMVSGVWTMALKPYADHMDPLGVTAVLYLAVAGLLSLRSGWRAMALRSLGYDVPKAGVRVLMGVVHLDLDLRERRLAARQDRLLLAWGGMASIALVAGLALWAFSLWPVALLRQVASVGLIVLLVDSAPYLKGDGGEVVAILARVPGLRRRSAHYLYRRVIWQLGRYGELQEMERRLMSVVAGWVVHGVVAIVLAYQVILPDLLGLLIDIFGGRAAVGGDVGLLTVGFEIYAACVLVVALGGLFGGVFLLGLAVIGRALHGLRPQRPIVRVAPSPEARARFEDQVQRIPFLSSLGPEVLDAFVATARHESYGPRRVIIKQGLLGDSFYWIAQGRCAVEVEELSGRVHRVAMLEAGDFFGEVALVHEVRRTATVRTVDAVTVMSFHRDDFLPLLERAGVPHTQVVRDIRNAAFLRGLPLFAHMPGESLSALLARLTELELKAGEPIVVQGEEADGMYVLREGEAVVEREEPGGIRLEVAHFEGGAWFGEIALLTGGRRTATVRALTDLVVLRIPRDAFRDVLMRHFATAVLLDHRCAARLDALEITDGDRNRAPTGDHSPSSTAR